MLIARWMPNSEYAKVIGVLTLHWQIFVKLLKNIISSNNCTFKILNDLYHLYFYKWIVVHFLVIKKKSCQFLPFSQFGLNSFIHNSFIFSSFFYCTSCARRLGLLIDRYLCAYLNELSHSSSFTHKTAQL